MMRTHLLMTAVALAMVADVTASPDVVIFPRHALEEGWHWYKDPTEIDDEDDLPPVVAEAMPPAPMTCQSSGVSRKCITAVERT